MIRVCSAHAMGKAGDGVETEHFDERRNAGRCAYLASAKATTPVAPDPHWAALPDGQTARVSPA